MSTDLLTVASFASTVEAEMVRSRLEEAGVPCVIADQSGVAGEAAFGARNVKVQVAQADFERAMRVLFPLPEFTSPPGEPNSQIPQFPILHWKCSQCGSEVDAPANNCWSCGAERPGEAGAPTLTSFRGTDADASEPLGNEAIVSNVRATLTDDLRGTTANSWADGAPPMPATSRELLAQGMAQPVMRFHVATDAATQRALQADRAAANRTARAADASARLAWLTSLVGLILPPVLIYSCIVLVELAFSNQALSRRGKLQYLGALVVNAAALVLIGWIWSRL